MRHRVPFPNVNRRVAIAGLCASLCVPAQSQRLQPFYELSLVTLDGKRTVLGRLPESVFAPRVSPDGRSVALELRDATRRGLPPGQERVWIADIKRPDKRRALPTVGIGRNWAPLWSHDGRRIIFLVTDGGSQTLWWRSADGTGPAEKLVDALSAEGVTPDGKGLTYVTLTGDRDYGISMLDLATRQTSVVIDRPRSEQHSSTVSPDGRWVAYASNEGGPHDIWVEPLPGNGQRYRLTRVGGSHPVWAPDGKRIYFDRGGALFGVDVRFTPSGPVASEPAPLPISGFQQGYRRRQFDVLPDGKQFLMLFPLGSRS